MTPKPLINIPLSQFSEIYWLHRISDHLGELNTTLTRIAVALERQPSHTPTSIRWHHSNPVQE